MAKRECLGSTKPTVPPAHISKKGKVKKINKAFWTIKRKLDCNSYNIVYAIICKNSCRQIYIAEITKVDIPNWQL